MPKFQMSLISSLVLLYSQYSTTATTLHFTHAFTLKYTHTNWRLVAESIQCDVIAYSSNITALQHVLPMDIHTVRREKTNEYDPVNIIKLISSDCYSARRT